MDGGWFTDGPPNFVSTKKLLAVTCELDILSSGAN